MTFDTDTLYNFGAWARDNPDTLGSRSAWALIMAGNVEQPRRGKGYDITDDTAMAIDRAVCQLNDANPHLAELFVLHYVGGLGYRTLAKHFKCGKGRIGDDLSKAGGYVIGAATTLAEKEKLREYN